MASHSASSGKPCHYEPLSRAIGNRPCDMLARVSLKIWARQHGLTPLYGMAHRDGDGAGFYAGRSGLPSLLQTIFCPPVLLRGPIQKNKNFFCEDETFWSSHPSNR